MKTSINQINKKDSKKSKRKGYEYLILLLLTISLFITATYAWFTDSAYSKGNKIFAGNLYIDIIASESDLKDTHNADYEEWLGEGNTDSFAEYLETLYEKYDRTYPNPNFDSALPIDEETNPEYITDTYYIITDEEAGGVNLYNMEPGQVRKLTVKYVNTGDLAFKAGGALKLEYEEDEDGKTIVDDDGNPILKSYTGLETLKKQKEKDLQVYKNEYAVSDEKGQLIIDPYKIMLDNNDHDSTNNHYSTDLMTPEEYEYRLNKLLRLQSKLDANGDPIIFEQDSRLFKKGSSNEKTITFDDKKYVDLGGKLEDVLEVYVIPSTNKDNTTKKEEVLPVEEAGEAGEAEEAPPAEKAGEVVPEPAGEIEEEDKEVIDDKATIDHEIFTNVDNKDHKKYYFGNLKQFTYLMEHGPEAIEDFDYKAYSSYINDDGNFVLTKSDGSSEGEGTAAAVEEIVPNNCSIEESYMFLYKSNEANLYKDYQRYLGSVGGYCLPKDAVTKDGTVTLPHKDGIDVVIYDENGTHNQRYSEMGECEIYLYMPTTADSRYQNASISLSIGATATQVEYEMDDTGYMLYDKFEYKNNDEDDDEDEEIIAGDVIEWFKNKNNYPVKVRVLNVDKDNNTMTVIPIISFDDEYQTTSGYDSTNVESNYYTSVEKGNKYAGLRYYGSDLNKKINSNYTELLNVCPDELQEAILPVSVTQYDFNAEMQPPSPILTADNPSAQTTYEYYDANNAKVTFTKVGYSKPIDNLYARSLTLTDIFEALNDADQTLNAQNAIKLLTNSNLVSGHAIAHGSGKAICLMDTFTDPDNDMYQFFTLNENGVLYYTKTAVSLTFVPVFTFDTKKYDVSNNLIEHFDGSGKKRINVGDIVRIYESEETKSKQAAEVRVLDIDDNYLTIAPMCNVSAMYDNKSYRYINDDYNSAVSFTSYNDDSLSGVNYNASSFKTGVDKDIDELVSAFPSIKDAIQQVSTKEYHFSMGPVSLQGNESVLPIKYIIDNNGKKSQLNRNGYLELGELKVRPLSITDIFECLNKIGVENTSDNVKKLLFTSNQPTSGGFMPASIIYLIPLLDAQASGSFYVNSEGVINKYLLNGKSPYIEGTFKYTPVYTIDTNKFKNIEYVSSFDSSSSGDKIKIGYASGDTGDVPNSKPTLSFLNLALENNDEFADKYEIVPKYLPEESDSILSATDSILQFDNIEQLLKDGAKYVVVDAIGGYRAEQFTSLSNKYPNANIFFVGNDTIGNIQMPKGGIRTDYLANIGDYYSAISDLFIDEYDSGDMINSRFIYCSSDFSENLLELMEDTDAFSQYKYNLLRSYDFDDESFDITDIIDNGTNIIFSPSIGILNIIYREYLPSMPEEDRPILVNYFDQIYVPKSGTAIKAYKYDHYGLYYNYEGVCNNVLKDIENIENPKEGQAQPAGENDLIMKKFNQGGGVKPVPTIE